MNRKIALFLSCFVLSTIIVRSQTTDIYTSPTTWTVPAHVYSVTVTAYGGGGGTGGLDCGTGCTMAPAGHAGYIVAVLPVVPGNIIGIYPGGKGGNGANAVSGSGGGSGGKATYAGYDGGAGGNTGTAGSSGAGGGGGAATVLTINSIIKMVAGGAAGSGGNGNNAGSGLAGNNTISPNGLSNAGGAGTQPTGDGGGGGGGGGGQYGSTGGGVHVAGIEKAGDGGFIGANFINGATTITSNSSVVWTTSGRIELAYDIALPVIWLGFNAAIQPDGSIRLNWSTAQEDDSKDFIIQHSTSSGNWQDIARLNAAGSSRVEMNYTFTDNKPGPGTNFYRIKEIDIDGRITISKTIIVKTTTSNKILIFPNPVRKGMLNLTLKTDEMITIYNSAGSKFKQQYYMSGTNMVDVASFPKGIYFLKTISEVIEFIIQ